MSRSLEIRRLLRKIENADAELRRQKRNMRSEVNGVPSWWKGNAANSFMQRYNGIDSDIDRLSRKLNDLMVNANRLLRILEEEQNKD